MTDQFDIEDVMEGWNLARRWATLRRRVLSLRREREKCEAEEPAYMGCDGVPPCWAAGQDGRTELWFSEWCGPCQRNQARYLYRQYTQKALTQAQRKLLKALA